MSFLRGVGAGVLFALLSWLFVGLIVAVIVYALAQAQVKGLDTAKGTTKQLGDTANELGATHDALWGLASRLGLVAVTPTPSTESKAP